MNQPGALRQGQEGVGPQQAQHRVLPAQKHLGLRRVFLLTHHDGLEAQAEFVPCQRQAQFVAQAGAAARGFLQRAGEVAIAIAALGLGAVERLVGALEQGRGIGRIVGVERHPDAARHLRQMLAELKGFAQAQHQGRGHPFDDGRPFAQIGQQHHKLVAAQARHHVDFAHGRL